MFNWLRELKDIWHEPRVCQSCEVLKIELSNERREKEMLLNHVLAPQSIEPERTVAPEPQVPILKSHVPWKVRQQMLEQSDREKARLLAEFKKKESEIRQANPSPNLTANSITPATSIEELEANLGIVREN